MTECTQPSTPSAPCPTGSSNPAAAPSVSRRGFLSGAAVAAGAAALAGLAGCAPKTQAEVAGETIAADDAATGGAMQTTDPAKAVWPVVEEVEVGSAGEGVVAFVAEPIAADEIVATHDVDVVVCGLGPAGDFPDFREQYDPTALSRSWNTSLNLPYPSGELADILTGILTEAGVEIRYETPACQLVADEAGSVTGVIVKSADGYEQYNCAKGVVLATGGYEFNQQMLKERCRPRSVPGRWLTGAFGNTGDGLQMGVAVGAAEDEFPQSIMLDPEQLMPFVRVNKLGKRFTPEYDPYGQLAMAIQYQPGTYDFYIVDSALDTKIDKIWTPSSSCYGPKEQWVAAAQSENAFKADTLEELAELMEVPADTFVETINHWNEMCAAGADTDFDMPGSMMMTIDQPPFYATKEFADGLCTTGGLIVDTECRVLDKDRQPIEGLFAAGIVSGGMFYNTYPHHLNCLSHTRNCLMGYTIGQVLGAKQ